MVLNKNREFFLKAVGVILLVQGLIWVALSITGIVVYFSPPDKLNNNIQTYDRYLDYLSRIIYDEFMGGKRDRIIKPKDFEAFLWLYMILSALWVALCIDQFTAAHYKKGRQFLVTLILGVTVLVTSIIDLVFVCLLGSDLNTCSFSLTTVTTTTVTTPSPVRSDSIRSQSISQSSFISLRNTGATSGGTAVDCKLANGIIMVIAARGFVLWIINVVLAIILITVGVKALKTPELQTYKKNTIPRARVPEPRKQPSTNDMVFLGDNVFPPSPVSQQNDHRNRSSNPVALTNKNHTMYY